MINFLKENYQNKSVLITGGAGFIGSNLVEKLIQINAKVFVIDNFLTGHINNLKPFLHKIHLIIGDIQDTNLLKKLFMKKNFFVIFHLAAISSVPYAEKDPSKCNKINVEALKSILNLLINKVHIPTIVFSSSSSVYGNTNEVCCEGITQPSPESVYGKSKHEGEIILMNFVKQKPDTKIIALRYFNVFGNKDRSKIRLGAVIPIFKKQLTSKRPITVFGDGTQLRDYVNVKKVVIANLVAAISNINGFNIFNVATGKSYSILELVSLLAKEKKISNPIVQFLPQRTGDVVNSQANSNKIDNLLLSFFNKRFS